MLKKTVLVLNISRYLGLKLWKSYKFDLNCFCEYGLRARLTIRHTRQKVPCTYKEKGAYEGQKGVKWSEKKAIDLKEIFALQISKSAYGLWEP